MNRIPVKLNKSNGGKMLEIVPIGFGEKTDEVIEEISLLLRQKASSLLANDVVFNTIGKNAEVTDIRGSEAPYILVRGHKGEKQLIELFKILDDEDYLCYAWGVVDLLLFVDKFCFTGGPGVK